MDQGTSNRSGPFGFPKSLSPKVLKKMEYLNWISKVRKDIIPWRSNQFKGREYKVGINHQFLSVLPEGTVYAVQHIHRHIHAPVKGDETTAVSKIFRAKMKLTVRSCTRVS